MKAVYVKRNICIGLIDGIIIPLALAAVLTRTNSQAQTIIIASLAVGVAGSITMSLGYFFEGRKYEPSKFSSTSALVVGFAYLIGSALVAFPFIFVPQVMNAFYTSVAICSGVLLVCGSIESSLHGANPFAGALRVWLTGIVAAGLAFFVAGLV